MKLLIYLFLALFFLTKAGAQQVFVNEIENDGKEQPLKQDTVASISSFWAKKIHDTAYIGLKIKNMHKDGAIILYSSTDGKNFDIVDKQEVVGVPVNLEIAHYFEEVGFPMGEVYYRVACINTDSESVLSDTIFVDGEYKYVAGNSNLRTH